MVPKPSVDQKPSRFVLAVIETGTLVQASNGPSTAAIAGVLTVTRAISDTGRQGPSPSGSDVCQINSMVLPISESSGKYCVDGFVSASNAPSPPDHEPEAFVRTVKSIAEVPHAM